MTEVMTKPQVTPDHSINPLLMKRWSPRAFADTPIAPSEVNKIFEAARWAASSFNEQPWRFVYAHKGDQAYDQLMETINPFNQSWASSAPLLILGVAKDDFSHNGATNRHANYDLGAAVANMSIQAAETDIYFHQMAGFDPSKAADLIGIPEGYTPVVMIAAGYIGDADALPENLRERENAPRERKAVNDFAFEGEFKKNN